MPTGPSKPEGVARRQDISPETDPVEVQVRGTPDSPCPRRSSARQWKRVPKTCASGPSTPAVEARRVHEEGGRPVATEIVQGQHDAVGGRGSSGRHSRAG